MKNSRFVFIVMIVQFFLLLPQQSFATCFFDSAAINSVATDCENNGGSVKNKFLSASRHCFKLCFYHHGIQFKNIRIEL
jgi:hypothetical protein